MPSSQERLAVAFVHHANQFLITDGYENRVGISAVAGQDGSATGLARVLETHLRYRVPLNLHISGTLLEALAWHCPTFFLGIRRLAEHDLLELLGSSYGQNMMRFFSREHNLRQLKEQLLIYENLLNWEMNSVRTFWVPERLWDTEALAPILTDHILQNGGYKYVIVDDRLLYPSSGCPSPRHVYDKARTWDPDNFRMYSVIDGCGLSVLPISTNLRLSIPPRNTKDLDRVRLQLQWLLDLNSHYGNDLIAIYADDMEKAAGVGWDQRGPSQYETLIKWVSENRWIEPVKISNWASYQTPAGSKVIEKGAYVELVNEFEADETYHKWYDDPRWAPYQAYYEWSQKRVKELTSQGSDPALIELAWKVLLATVWQTAWHTPRTGAHGEADSDTGPSAWIKAITSHSRLAAIMAEAAYWMCHKDEYAHAYLQDLDADGESELVVKNESAFGVFSPRNGGRLVALFSISGSPGRLVVGNPIDDWNLLEDLHGYMDLPTNHPGAFSDIGFEHDNFVSDIQHPEGKEVIVSLRNVSQNSLASGLLKSVRLGRGEASIRVDYTLPSLGGQFSTEVGLSPDYLKLLRHARMGVKEFSPATHVRGWANENIAVSVRLAKGSAFWDTPRQREFGHGYLLRITTRQQNFTVWLEVDRVN